MRVPGITIAMSLKLTLTTEAECKTCKTFMKRSCFWNRVWKEQFGWLC